MDKSMAAACSFKLQRLISLSINLEYFLCLSIQLQINFLYFDAAVLKTRLNETKVADCITNA